MSFFIEDNEFLRKLEFTQSLANELMQEHGLSEWKFQLSNQKERVGECRHAEKVIRYSQHYIEKTPESEIRDTILHEIAHALVGSGHGHDWTWKMKCLEIGAKPERLTWESQTTANHNYRITCNGCGKSWKRHRLKRGYLNGRYVSTCCGASMTVEELNGV